MVECDLAGKYGSLTDSERIAMLRAIINYDMPPLSILFAILVILEPGRIEEIFKKLGN